MRLLRVSFISGFEKLAVGINPCVLVFLKKALLLGVYALLDFDLGDGVVRTVFEANLCILEGVIGVAGERWARGAMGSRKEPQ